MEYGKTRKVFFGAAVSAHKKFGIFAVNHQSFEFKYVSYEAGIDSAFNKGGKRCIYKVCLLYTSPSPRDRG